MTDESTPPPTSRYGQGGLRRLPHRFAAVVLGLLGLAAVVAVVVLGYQRLGGTGEVKGDLYGYELLNDHTVSVKINVTRSDPSQPAVCIVRVRTKDGSETGRREVLIGPSTSSTVQVTTTLQSSQPPVMGDIYGCGNDVPGYLRSP